ncbi:SURF1 family protein [Streptomyces sp. NPDC006879]|uniref:SURF1 family protein n=1 Tax=Streptomyces sp. NPDC006879 TaxID=3364767 RepID=UPI0036CC393F
MRHFLLTPRWWGINLFVLLAVPFCLFMGTWQLGRFEDRVETHREASAPREGSPQDARPLESLLPVTKATSGQWAKASGRYAEQFLVPARELDGESGSYVLTLLRTDGGKALPVVRGWLPGPADAAALPAPPAGRVEVTGALQAPENSGTEGAHAGGGLPAGQVGLISAASLVNLVPYEVYPAWVTLPQAPADAAGMRAVPAAAPQNTGLDLKAFQNLGYTGEWFVFVAFVLFMWVRLYRREVEALRDAEAGLDGAAEPVAETVPAGGAAGSRGAAKSGPAGGSSS